MNAYTWSTRVYYQHTDAGGVVFHSRYLDFMECARTELLQALGFDLGLLAREQHLLFMVYSVAIDYRLPARLNDMITVSAEVAEVGRARLLFRQQVMRGAALLAQADITLVCVDARSLKPVPVPQAIRASLEGLPGAAAATAATSPAGTS